MLYLCIIISHYLWYFNFKSLSSNFFCVNSFINIKLIDFLKWTPLEISLLACMGHPWFTQCHYLTVSKLSCNCYSLSEAKIKFYLWYIVVSQFIKLFIFMFDILYDSFFRINLSIDLSCGHQITLILWRPPANPSCGRQITLLLWRPPDNTSSGRQITLLLWRPPDNPSSGRQKTLLFWWPPDNSSLLAAAEKTPDKL